MKKEIKKNKNSASKIIENKTTLDILTKKTSG